jgi:hypothetical protein
VETNTVLSRIGKDEDASKSIVSKKVRQGDMLTQKGSFLAEFMDLF